MFGFSTNEGVKAVWDGHFTNVLAEIWVQSLNVYGFFGLSSDLRGILVNYAKVIDGGQRVEKSVQCLSVAEVLDLECSLTLFPRAHDISPM